MNRQLRFWVVMLTLAVLCCPPLTASAGVFDWPRNVESASARQITLSGTAGGTIAFSPAELERQLGMESGSLRALTVIDYRGGSLTAQGEPVERGTSFSREELGTLAYLANESPAIITLLPNGGEIRPVNLSIRTADAGLVRPTASDQQLEAISGITSYGQFAVYGPNGERPAIRLVVPPEKGTLTISGTGFSYTPYPSEQGTDQFCYLAAGVGGVSDQATVSVEISAYDEQYDYWDLNGSYAYYSAVQLLENGIFCGEQIGSRRYFEPQRQMTRAEWMMALTAACGMGENLSSVSVYTGLENDGELPLWLKPYLTAAKENGCLIERSFFPDEIPTMAEAVTWTDRFCALETVTRCNPCWEDISEIPDWALQSYMNLEGYGMLSAHFNRVEPTALLTRERAADLLWQAAKYCSMEK